MKPIVAQYRLKNWLAAKNLAGIIPGYLFRGHAVAGWNLSTSIERAAMLGRCPLTMLKNQEDWILQQFQRRAHHYLSDPPTESDRLDWLALIQHYGGPTRLLDFTHSFYVAAFFAMEKAETEAAVWCINPQPLGISAGTQLGFDFMKMNLLRGNAALSEFAEQVLAGKAFDKRVVHVEPFRLPVRIAAQQGIFLMPCDIGATFLDNLLTTVQDGTYAPAGDIEDVTDAANVKMNPCDSPIVKIVLPRDFHTSALLDLANMNITATTLFEGLDGFARSLHWYVRLEMS